MSRVRMCDVSICGKIFPENEEGSQSYTGKVNRKYQDGTSYQEQVDRDMCADCASGNFDKKPVPMPELKGSEMPVQ